MVRPFAKSSLTELSTGVFARLSFRKRSKLRIIHLDLWNDAARSPLLVGSEDVSCRINTLLEVLTNTEIFSYKEDGCPLLLVPLVLVCVTGHINMDSREGKSTKLVNG